MSRFLHRSTLAAALGLALAGPASAATVTGAGQASEQQLVDASTRTVRAMEANSGALGQQLLRQARAVLVFPQVISGGFVIGGSGGQGVLVAHTAQGWSDPAFYITGSVSVGAQVGGQESAVVMFIMSERAYRDLLDNNNFQLSAKAGLTIVQAQAGARANFNQADVVVWSAAQGAYAGVALSGTDVAQHAAADRAYYGRAVTAAQIVRGSVRNPQAAPLVQALQAG